mmetsp:Transcript_27323/g.60682  ORF Transcript_27323/g.60682 Transcript_27323/m.60682 type:complete len:308 (+) Transcript_27323:39-962(+)|eukprot:CAMPEP_0178508562 /NCGR_PEP_ID=MMETSP0696-20121128/20820_1 /TAXON_ID=265572 /ORGANISM="Extubocellulus spinifer, Strain CCMP396" /LENGTH=307 /DNA_ID=CAMNT_0020138127 /DNA_START=9 /DNA_END=935 /DNA_ORIENTATION=+
MTEETTIDCQGTKCVLHKWEASTDSPLGVCVVYHGFLAHGKYPTVRYAAELLSSNNYTVIAVDLPGHGKSPGLRGYLPGADELIATGAAVAEYGAKLCCNADDDEVPLLPLFLVGSSMGGTIALAVATELSEASSSPSALAGKALKGVLLLAPMLELDVATPLRYILYGLASTPILSTTPLIPSSATSAEKQYRDADKLKECEDDPLTVDTGGKLRPASASTCVELANGIMGERFDQVTVPFLCMVAKEDVVVKNAGSYRLMEEAASTDKTLKEYDALHGLLCEPPPLINEIHADLMMWVNERAGGQ